MSQKFEVTKTFGQHKIFKIDVSVHKFREYFQEL